MVGKWCVGRWSVDRSMLVRSLIHSFEFPYIYMTSTRGARSQINFENEKP